MFVENYHSFTESRGEKRVTVKRLNSGQPSTSTLYELKIDNAEFKTEMSQPLTKLDSLAIHKRLDKLEKQNEIISKATYKGLPNEGKRRYIKEIENSSNIEQAADLSGVKVGWAKTQAANAKNNGK